MALGVLVSCGDTAKDGVGTDSSVTTDTNAEDNTEADEPYKEETLAPVELKEYDLKEFKIVYADDAYAVYAETLRDEIKAKTSVELEAVKDGSSGKNGELVLMVGECMRSFSKTALDYSNTLYFDKVGVVCEKGRVQLLGRDVRTLDASIDYFLENLVNNNSEKLMIPEEGALGTINPAKGDTIPKKTTKNTLRVVTNNILLQDILRSADRATDLFSAYMLMDADVYCLQEVDMLWHAFYKLDTNMKRMGYEVYPPNNTNARNPIYYKSEVFKLVDGGNKLYDGSSFTDGTYPQSFYNWVCLEHKETGKKIIVASTHFIARMTNADLTEEQRLEKANIYREESARQLIAGLDEIKSTQSADAVIVMGDFNNNCESPAYKLLSSKLNSAREKCSSTKNMNYQTYLGQPLGKEPKKGSDKVIDHVFYTGAIDAKHYETVISPYTYAYSDHVPVLFDFILK